MRIRIRNLLVFLAATWIVCASTAPVLAGEKPKHTTQKGEKAAVAAASEKAVVSATFMMRWKQIQQISRKRAYEIQQARTGAGVRGAEAEDRILERLYFKGQADAMKG